MSPAAVTIRIPAGAHHRRAERFEEEAIMAQGKRELIQPGTTKRYVRRDARGRFTDSTDVGRSLSQDRQRDAQNTTTKGQGDRGDRTTK
jgi:hypothetical protein